MGIRELDRQPLGGGENRNYHIFYGEKAALLRVPQTSRMEVNDVLQEYYAYTGFTRQDQGVVRKRTPSEQFDFSTAAARASLAVLPPLTQEGDTIVYPFLSNTQTLMDYLQSDAGDKDHLLHRIFFDLRNAHRLGFLYGDRNAENVLVGEKDFIHIDFDLAISGKTAREFEVSELAMHTLYYGGETMIPTLATILGTMCAETPRWLNLDITQRYMSRMGELLHTNRGFTESGLKDQEALVAAMRATRDSVRTSR